MKLLLVFAFATSAFAGPINSTLCENAIIEGNAALPGQFAYYISIRDYGQHICGGSIIDDFTILTAAHCVDEKPIKDLSIVAGCLHLDKGGDSYSVSRYVIHEFYNPVKIMNDVAVIKLTTSIEVTFYVIPIFLDDREMRAGTKIVFMGWGDSTQPEAVVNNLLYVTGEIIDLEVCKSKLVTWNNTLSNRNICAVSNYQGGHCLGDSGGPLVYNYRQIGVSSWLSECGTGDPDVYSALSFYYRWIIKQLRKPD